MKSKYLIYYFWGFLILNFLSCSNDKTKLNINNCIIKNDIYTLKKDKTISFKLDSSTSPHIEFLKLINKNDSVFLTFLNENTSTIYSYNYEEKTLNRTIKLSNLGTYLSGYEIIDWDSIITYQYKSDKLILEDGLGNILKHIMIPPNAVNGFSASVTSHRPIIYDDKDIYIAGAQVSIEKANKSSMPIVRVNHSFSEKTYLYKFPKIYETHFFGGANYRLGLSYAYNENENLFVLSFPASHDILITKNFETEETFCAGSQYIKSISEYPDGEGTMNPEKAFEHCTVNGFYQGILYDKYNDLYYRLCLLPSKWNGIDKYSRDLSIIILDKNFNVVGEKLLKNNKDFYLDRISTVSVSPDGILLQKRNDLFDESTLDFVVYKIIKI